MIKLRVKEASCEYCPGDRRPAYDNGREERIFMEIWGFAQGPNTLIKDPALFMVPKENVEIYVYYQEPIGPQKSGWLL